MTEPMMWRGQSFLPTDGCQAAVPRPIADLVPVRIPLSAVQQLPQRASRSTEGDWILGLAIRSYLQPGRREIMYVILLDDGHELHLPCRQVHHISLTTTTDNIQAYNNDSLHGMNTLPGHPSSLDAGESSDYFSDAAVENFACSDDHMLRDDCWPTPSGSTGHDLLLPLTSAFDETESYGEWRVVDRSDEAALDRKPVLEMDRLPAFSSVFQQVLLDNVISNNDKTGFRFSQSDNSTFDVDATTGPSMQPTELPNHFQETRPLPSTEARNPQPLRRTVLLKQARSQGKCPDSPATTRRDCRSSGTRVGVRQQTRAAAPAPFPVPAHVINTTTLIKKSTGEAYEMEGYDVQSSEAATRIRSPRRARRNAAVASNAELPQRALFPSARMVHSAASSGAEAASRCGRVHTPGLGRVPTTLVQRASRASAKVEAAAFARFFREETWTTEHTTFVHDPV